MRKPKVGELWERIPDVGTDELTKFPVVIILQVIDDEWVNSVTYSYPGKGDVEDQYNGFLYLRHIGYIQSLSNFLKLYRPSKSVMVKDELDELLK